MALLTPAQVISRVRGLAARQESKFIDLGIELTKLRAVTSGAKFKSIVSREGVGTRKAYYLIKIVERLRPHMRSRARLHRLGWTKCQLIADRLPEEEFFDVLEFAEQHSVQELKAHGRQPTKAQHRCVLLYFTPDQYRQYERAMLSCGAKRQGRGLMNKEAAVIRMAKIVADVQ